MRELRVGDRVSGYGDGVGVLTLIGPESRGGDCKVAWEEGYAIEGETLGATLNQLTRIPKHRSEEPLDPKKNILGFLMEEAGYIRRYMTKHRAEGEAN